MAIQLARAIGMQRKPISPLEGLSDIIQKTGEGIAKGMEEKASQEAKKEAKNEAIKTATLAKINVKPPEATPEQSAEYENYVKSTVPPLIADFESGKISSAEFQKRADQIIYDLEERRIKYKKDLDTMAKYGDPKIKEGYYTEEFDRFIGGTPDRVETIPPDFTMNAPYKEKSMMDVEPESEQAVAKPEKRIIKGQPGYFSLPYEEQKKIDFEGMFQKSLVPKTVGALEAFKDYAPNFKPESMISIHKDNKGVITAERDEPLIERNRELYVMSMLSPESYGEKHDIEKRALQNIAIGKMERDNVPDERKAELLPEYIKAMAAQSFDRVVDATYEYESRKTNEEMLKGKSGGLVITSGGGESKKDTYVDDEKYNTDLAARSTYENVVAEKNFKKYISDQDKKNRLAKQFKVSLDDEQGLRKAWEKLNQEPSAVSKGMTVEEGWIAQTKRDLSLYEGKPSISFNNKSEEHVAFAVDKKLRQYIPSRVIYDKKDGSVLGFEAYAAVKGADDKYVKKSESLEIIPATKFNFDAVKNNFSELFKYAKGRGVELSYNEGKKPKGEVANEKAPATKGNEGAKNYGLRNDGTPKGKGYFGELKMKDGSGKIATEISISPKVNGKTMDIPSLVPTLTEAEKDWLLTNGMKGDDVWEQPIAKSIEKKAIAHAEKRIKEGKSVFAGSEKKVETPKNKYVKGYQQGGYEFMGGDPADSKNWKKIK